MSDNWKILPDGRMRTIVRVTTPGGEAMTFAFDAPRGFTTVYAGSHEFDADLEPFRLDRG